MARKKKQVQPTFDERLNAAYATAGAALSAFELTARDLEQAAVEKREIVADIALERVRLEDAIYRLDLLADEADLAATAAETKANNIRALISA